MTRLVTGGSGACGAFTPSAADGLSATTDNVSAPIVVCSPALMEAEQRGAQSFVKEK